MGSETADLNQLRTLAEATLAGTPELEAGFCSCDESDKLLHELKVYQIELEMQNENLRQAYVALEESHERYIDLFEFAPVGYLILSANGLISNINLTGTTLLGTERSHLLSQHFTRLVDHTDRDRWQLFFWSLLRFNSRNMIEIKLKRADNTVFYAQLEGIRMSTLNEGDNVRLALLDISKQKQLESVERRCERYQLAENGSTDAIWDWDIGTNQIHYAERWYQMLGYWNCSLNNTFACWESLLHPDDHDETMKRLQQHLEEHTPFIVEYRLRAGTGQYRWLLASGQAVWNEQGQPIRMSGKVSDITERKETELALIEARQLADQASRMKSEFLANISHEIRTPMNAIIGMTYLAQRTELSPAQHNYLSKIDLAAHSLLGIIDSILDFSKIEAGQFELEHVSFSLNHVFDHLVEMTEAKAKQKNIGLVFNIASQTPLLLMGDSHQLSQILLNLVNNAIKFSNSGSVIISVAPEQQNTATVRLQFSVQDSGIGISPEQSGTLFQPFLQLDSSITRKYGGTGLGLAISKQLVDLMGGQIWLESEPGKGSVFFFTAVFDISAQNLLPQQLDETVAIVDELTGRRVLLVEDDIINREVAKELLTDLGIQVAIAENGSQAVQQATTGVFDLILMDVQMPEMNGLTAAGLIRADPDLQNLPIIAITANAMSGDREKCLAAGMNDYLSKPIESEKLAKTLKNWLKPKPSGVQAPLQAQMIYDGILPLTLPPFNIAAALAKMNGNSKLLHKLILMFHDNHATIGEDLRRLIAANNYEEAQRQAHTLKGAAIMLAVEELPAIAGKVEQAIQVRDIKQMNHFIKVLEAVLTPAIQAAASLLSQSAT